MNLDKEHLLVRCVYLYYHDRLNIKEIAERLSISRFKVSRYIKQAEEKGYVQFRFNFPADQYDILATKIEEKYSIESVIIVPVIPDMDVNMIRKSVGQKGAEIFKRVKEDSSIGITWGRTIAKMVEDLPPFVVKLNRITELTGGYGMIDTSVSSSSLAPILAKKTRSSCFQIHAPILASSEEVAKSILKEDSIKRTLELAAKSDIAFFGAASVSKDSMFYNSQIMTEEELINLYKMGVRGSVIGRFFDQNGKEVDTEYKRRAISIPWEIFLNIPERVALVSGRGKLECLKGLLRGRLATTLIVDSFIATELMNSEPDLRV